MEATKNAIKAGPDDGVTVEHRSLSRTESQQEGQIISYADVDPALESKMSLVNDVCNLTMLPAFDLTLSRLLIKLAGRRTTQSSSA